VRWFTLGKKIIDEGSSVLEALCDIFNAKGLEAAVTRPGKLNRLGSL
jgi:hypothetical protein